MKLPPPLPGRLVREKAAGDEMSYVDQECVACDVAMELDVTERRGR